MTAIEHMKAEITRNAEEEAAGIIEKAEKEAKAILEEARREASEAEERALGEMPPKLKRVREEITREAVSDGRRRLVQFKEKLISEVFDRLDEESRQLARVGGEKYEDLLHGLIEEGARNIREQTIGVTANGRDSTLLRRDLERVEKNLMEKLGRTIEINLSNDTLDCVGGVIVSSMDGKLIYYNTLESRIMRLREKMRLDVAKILFGE